MKTLVLTVTNDLTYDQRMMRICGALASRYDVVLVGRERRGSAPLDARPYEQVRLRCLFERGKLFYAELNLRLFFFLLGRRFDLVCSIDLDTILAGYHASRLKGALHVYDAHEIFTEIPELANRPRVRGVWLAIERAIVPRVRHAYTVNASLAEIFRERYGARFEIIRNMPPLRDAADARAGAAGRVRDQRTIFYQGVLNVGRGLEALVDAMQTIDARLVLAGEGDISEALRARVRALGLDEKVRFLGYVRPADLPAVMREAGIAVNLRERLGLNDYYSLGNKFFDYIHAELPADHDGVSRVRAGERGARGGGADRRLARGDDSRGDRAAARRARRVRAAARELPRRAPGLQLGSRERAAARVLRSRVPR